VTISPLKSAFASWVVATLSRTIQLIYGMGTALFDIYEKLRAWGGFPETREVTIKKLVLFYPLVGAFIAGFVLRSTYLILVIPLLLLCISCSVPFGIDAALAAVVVEFSAESTPIGTAPVVSLNAPTVKGLWHSLPYNDPEAFKAIVRWINSHREEEEQPISLKDVAVAIRNYAVSRNRFDWREVEDRLTAVEERHQAIAANLGLSPTFSNPRSVEGGSHEAVLTILPGEAPDSRKLAFAILVEAANLFRALRTLAGLDVELQMKQLGRIAYRLEYIGTDLQKEIAVINDHLLRVLKEHLPNYPWERRDPSSLK
jgi:hypothetical protein